MRERVQQLARVIAVPLDPSPPPSGYSPMLAAACPRENSGVLDLFVAVFFFPVLPGLLCTMGSSPRLPVALPRVHAREHTSVTVPAWPPHPAGI